MSFLETKYMFPDHAKIFTVSKRCEIVQRLTLAMIDRHDNPAEQQAAIQELVEEHRPELKNCVVYLFDYDVHRQCWRIAVSHPSLPEVGYGYMLEDEPLIRPNRTIDEVVEELNEGNETWRDREKLL